MRHSGNNRIPTAFWPVVVLLGGLILCGACAGNKNKSEIQASGTIEATEVNVSARVSGQVREIRVEEGSRVKAGDVLVLIDHDSLDIQLRQAEAGVALAEAQLHLLRAGARAEDLEQARDGLHQAESNFKLAEADAKRMRELAAKGSVTPKQRDDAEARLTVAAAQKNTAGEALKKLQQFARPEELKAAQARLDQAVAQADLLKKAIADCTIAAPVGGVVTRKPVEAGELVQAGATVLTVSDLDRVNLMIYVTEKELGQVKLGQTASVTIDSAPGRIFSGKVTYISPEAEFTPKNIQTKEDRAKLVFRVKVEIDNPEGALKPGLPADAIIPLLRNG
jgi:HlyD family secretion protein